MHWENHCELRRRHPSTSRILPSPPLTSAGIVASPMPPQAGASYHSPTSATSTPASIVDRSTMRHPLSPYSLPFPSRSPPGSHSHWNPDGVPCRNHTSNHDQDSQQGHQHPIDDAITLDRVLLSFRPFFGDAGLPRAPEDVLRIHSGLLRAQLEGSLVAGRRDRWNGVVREAVALRWGREDVDIWTQLFV